MTPYRKARELSCMSIWIHASVNENIDDVMLNLSKAHTKKESGNQNVTTTNEKDLYNSKTEVPTCTLRKKQAYQRVIEVRRMSTHIPQGATSLGSDARIRVVETGFQGIPKIGLSDRLIKVLCHMPDPHGYSYFYTCQPTAIYTHSLSVALLPTYLKGLNAP